MLHPAYLWQRVFQEIPDNGCLALAALDELISYHSSSSPDALGSQRLLYYLEHALARVPQHIIYQFLANRLDAPTPVLIRALCLVLSHKDSTSEQKEHLLDILQKKAITPQKFSECFSFPPGLETTAFSPEVPGEIYRAWVRSRAKAARVAPPDAGEACSH